MAIEKLCARANNMQSTADLPILDEVPVVINVTPDSLAGLADYGIQVNGGLGQGNVVVLNANQRKLDVMLDVSQSVGGLVVIGDSHPITLKLTMRGVDQIACFSGISNSQGHNRLDARMHGGGSLLHIGSSFTVVSATSAVFGDNRLVSFGKDCMLSWSINMINYDQHTIFEMETGKVLNAPTDMRIGRHVWIGQDVLFTRGLRVGDGSIIGTRALVTADIPARSLAVGVPARVQRSGVSWTRAWMGNPEAIAEIRKMDTIFSD